jgi:small-conductance mechanosensitive channel
MYNSYGVSPTILDSSPKFAASGIWTIVSVILAIIGGIVLYFTFLSKKNEGKFTGFLGWLYDFLTFKKMMIENVLKILYIIVALFVTLSSFGLISISFLAFLLTLVIGNVLTRVIYELLLVKLVICKNTTEINKKLNK